MKSIHPSLFVLFLGLLLLLPACGGSGGAAGTSDSDLAPAAVGFTVQDAPVDGFSNVTIELTDLRLLTQSGDRTANLLAAPRSFDFLGLSLKQALLALAPSVPAGTYHSVELTVGAVEILDTLAAPVTVTVTQATSQASLTAGGGNPLVFADAFTPCSLDIDLDGSLQEDPGQAGTFLFGLKFSANTSIAPALDEIRGEVTQIEASRSRFTMRVIGAGSSTGGFGSMEVVVNDGDFLAHDDGRTFATAAAFLDELDLGEVVQVSGSLQPNGVFQASRVVEEDDDGLSGSNRIEIEGIVRSMDTVTRTFVLQVMEIEKGASAAAPVLAAQANPNLLSVSYNSSTFVFADDSNSSGTGIIPQSVQVGMEVDVRFAELSGSAPYLASSLEIGDGRSGSDDGVEYEGICTDISGLPQEFMLTLDQSESAWISGLVTAPVRVPLASAPRIFLDAGPEPSLEANELQENLKMKVYGDLSGPAASATLVPTTVKVKPGELEGVLTAVDLQSNTMTITVTKVKRAFGGAPTPAGSVVFQVASGAELETDQGGRALVDFASLLGSSTVEVRLEGIRHPVDGLTAWEVEED